MLQFVLSSVLQFQQCLLYAFFPEVCDQSEFVRYVLLKSIFQCNQSHTIKTLGVVGVGQMGCGIAQVAAQHAKLNVLLIDADRDKLQKSLDFMGAY